MKTFKISLCILGTILLELAAVYCGFVFWHSRRTAEYRGAYTFHFINGTLFTWTKLLLAYDEIPSPTSPEVKELLKKTDSPFEKNRELYTFFSQRKKQLDDTVWDELQKWSSDGYFVDEWGRPLIISFSIESGKGDSKSIVAIAHSFGENGTDESWKGDDIVAVWDGLIKGGLRKNFRSPTGKYESRFDNFTRRNQRPISFSLMIMFGVGGGLCGIICISRWCRRW